MNNDTETSSLAELLKASIEDGDDNTVKELDIALDTIDKLRQTITDLEERLSDKGHKIHKLEIKLYASKMKAKHYKDCLKTVIKL